MSGIQGIVIHTNLGLREHRRKFRIDGVNGSKRLAQALKVLEEHHQAIDLALAANHCNSPERSVADVRSALRLLVEGAKGEFK